MVGFVHTEHGTIFKASIPLVNSQTSKRMQLWEASNKQDVGFSRARLRSLSRACSRDLVWCVAISMLIERQLHQKNQWSDFCCKWLGDPNPPLKVSKHHVAKSLAGQPQPEPNFELAE
jgi:hypothetical protein